MNLWRDVAEDHVQLVDVDPVLVTSEPEGQAAPEAFDAFYHREYRPLLVLARALVGAAAADDVVQDAMLVAYRRWDEVQLLESPGGWVRSVCAHKAVSALRHLGVERRGLRRLLSAAPVTADGPVADEDFWALVRRLPARQAQVVALHYALDLGVADVAATLGCSEGTVKVHLSRARASLARILDEEDES